MATDDDKVGDIEKQLVASPPHHEIPPPPPTSPTTQKPTTAPSTIVIDNNGKAGVEAAEFTTRNSPDAAAPAPAATTTTPPSATAASFAFKARSAVLFVIKCTIWLISCIVAYPLVLAYQTASICLVGTVKSPDECFSSEKSDDGNKLSDPAGPRPKGIYKKMMELESTKKKIQRFGRNTTTRLGCLALLWLVLTLCIPRLTTLFGDRLWKWSLLVDVILLGHPATTLFTTFLSFYLFCIFEELISEKNNIFYFMYALEYSFASLLYFAFILLVWLFYFRTEHGLQPSEKVDKFATWTFVSLLVGAFLWVTKTAALLEWKANAVYKRFKGRILTAGFQLYFLSIIINGWRFPCLLPWRNDNKPSSTIISTDEERATQDRKKLRIQDYWLTKPVPIKPIDVVATYVTDLAQVTLRDNDGIPEIVAKCQQKISTTQDKSTVQYITKEVLKENFGLDEDDALLLLQELKGEQMAEEITDDAFQKWIVDAHKNCLSVGYTLIDAFAVISILNRVIIGFIVVTVILVWLLITGLATTKVLVLIASPILTFSFVFGDTCKTFFQGIIFSFVTHPFDVGDRCIIDGIELEVKRIGILTTIFVKIGSKEKVIHPNTTLAMKVITNLEGEPDPSDMIELSLDSSTTMSKILSWKKDVESFFQSSDRHGSYENTIHVAVKEIGSSIKVGISLTHVMNVHDVSHSQCLQKKSNQRFELLVEIKQLLEDHEIKLAALIS